MGKIVAIGGGENGRPGKPYETGAIDRAIVSLADKKQPHFLFVGLASTHADFYYQVMRRIYHEQFACTTDHLTADDIKDSDTAFRKIDAADIIYVGGGNTLKLMTLLRRYGIDAYLKQAFLQSKVLCGLSAGAICWCEYGNSDSRKFTSGSELFIKVKGLGLIPVLMCPHYDTEPKRQIDLPRMMKNTYKIPAIALDNGAALMIKGGMFRIITSLDNAKAYKCFWQKGIFATEELPTERDFDINTLCVK